MDAFIVAASDLSKQLIPILGLTVLIILIVLLAKLINLVKTVESTVKRTDNTIDLVDQSLTKVQAPLDTVVKVSHTVDKAHDATVKAVVETKEYLSKNAENIKSKVKDVADTLVSKTKKEPKEPSPEDIIGGK